MLSANLRWEVFVTLAIGMAAAIAGADVTATVLIPIAAILALAVVVIASNVFLTPVRMSQAAAVRESNLRDQLRKEQGQAAIRNEIANIYEWGKRILKAMESENYPNYLCERAVVAWRQGVTAFYQRIEQRGRAATWDAEFELDAADKYSTGEKIITGDLARSCHILRCALREIADDVRRIGATH